MIGGFWGYPAGIRTMQGDMNISALYPAWSKTSVLISTSGYRFEQALGARKAQGEKYCETASPWPAIGSTSVVDDLAIICLQK